MSALIKRAGCYRCEGRRRTPGREGDTGPQGAPGGSIGAIDDLDGVDCTRGSAAGHVDVRTSLDGSVTGFCDAPIANLAFTSFFGSGFGNGTQNASILTTVRNIGTAPAQDVSLRVSLTRSPSGLPPVPVTVPSACTNLGFGAVYECDIGDLQPGDDRDQSPERERPAHRSRLALLRLNALGSVWRTAPA